MWFLRFLGGFRLVFFSGPRKRANFAIFLLLLDPGRPREPTVGSHSDCVVSWDTVGGIQALGCPQGPPETGFGAAKKRRARRRARLVGHFGLVLGRKRQNSQSSILTDPWCPMDPKVGSHSVCVLSWDSLEGFQALFCVLGTLEIRFWASARWLRGKAGSFPRLN